MIKRIATPPTGSEKKKNDTMMPAAQKHDTIVPAATQEIVAVANDVAVAKDVILFGKKMRSEEDVERTFSKYKSVIKLSPNGRVKPALNHFAHLLI